MKALILAAGKGKRLRPLTNKVPKALVPICRKPMIEYSLDMLNRSNINAVGIVVSPKNIDKIKHHLKNGKRWHLKINYIIQKKPLGTYHALLQAEEFINNERFVLIYCDCITEYNLKELIEYHLKHKPVATLVLNKEKHIENTSQVLFKRKKVIKIKEKQREFFSYYTVSGIMLLEPIIFKARPYVKLSKEKEYHIADALQYLINKGKRVLYKKINCWRVNVNTFEDIKKVKKCLKKE